MEMILHKKQMSNFLFKFKMGHKAAETTRNINTAFGPGTTNKQTMQWLIKSSAKEKRDLKDEEHRGRLSEVDSNQLKAIIKADHLKIM